MTSYPRGRRRSGRLLATILAGAVGAGAVLASGAAAAEHEPTATQAVSSTEYATAGTSMPKVTRAQVMARADTWIHPKPVDYSMDETHGGYRADCSGYVSMAWGLAREGAGTATLANYARRIQKKDLKAGDILLWDNTGPGVGHVVLFQKWANKSHTRYWAYEQTPPHTKHHVIPYPYYNSSGPYLPYRYKGILETPKSHRPVTADVTGDHRDDLLGLRDGRLYLYKGTRSNDFTSARKLANHGYKRTWLGTADMGGKGRTSVLGLTGGKLYLYATNNKKDTKADFKPAKRLKNHTYTGRTLFTGDFNNDGYTDLFATKTGSLVVYPNNKHGDFGKPKTLTPRGYKRNWIGTGDINDDGYDDMLATTNNHMTAYLNNHKGDFTTPNPLTTNTYNHTQLLS